MHPPVIKDQLLELRNRDRIPMDFDGIAGVCILQDNDITYIVQVRGVKLPRLAISLRLFTCGSPSEVVQVGDGADVAVVTSGDRVMLVYEG
jgi:hypothetical protein